MLKEVFKEIINKDSYLNQQVYCFLSKRKNEEMYKIYEDMTDWDTISDVSLLKNFRNQVEKGQSYFTTDPNLSNYRIYGNWYNIFGDLLDDVSNIIRYPSLEHGLIFHNKIFTDLKYTSRPCVATYGEFRKNIIRKYITRPIFCLGPYIHYADNFYPENKINKLKKENGSTLLVFPTHSTNVSEVSFNQNLFMSNIRRISKKFNHVIVNAFWWNINDPFIEKLKAEGYQVVSAGYRDDVKFLNRLKTIISLADLAVGDSIGSHIGYCIAEGTPFSLIDLNTKIKLYKRDEIDDLDFVNKHKKIVSEAFLNSKFITNEQLEICNKYWGLNKLKNKEELRKIVQISQNIFNLSKGNFFFEENAIRKVLAEYQNSADKLGYALLRDALR